MGVKAYVTICFLNLDEYHLTPVILALIKYEKNNRNSSYTVRCWAVESLSTQE